jgi:hypothetical protein
MSGRREKAIAQSWLFAIGVEALGLLTTRLYPPATPNGGLAMVPSEWTRAARIE